MLIGIYYIVIHEPTCLASPSHKPYWFPWVSILYTFDVLKIYLEKCGNNKLYLPLELGKLFILSQRLANFFRQVYISKGITTKAKASFKTENASTNSKD